MNKFTFLSLLAVAASTFSVACAGTAGDDAVASEEALDAMGLPEGEPIVPPYLQDRVAPGRFALTLTPGQPDPGSSTTLVLRGGAGNRGEAVLTIASTSILEGEPVIAGVPGLPLVETRGYTLTASSNACGQVYTGFPSGGVAPAGLPGDIIVSNEITIYDYRNPGPACAADIAAALTVEEHVNGATNRWYGEEIADAK